MKYRCGHAGCPRAGTFYIEMRVPWLGREGVFTAYKSSVTFCAEHATGVTIDEIVTPVVREELEALKEAQPIDPEHTSISPVIINKAYRDAVRDTVRGVAGHA